MKRKRISFLLVCLSTFGVEGQTYFDKNYYSGSNNLFTSNIITAEDSGHVFINYVRDSVTLNQDLCIIKIDKHGNEQIKKTYNLLNSDHGLIGGGGFKHFIPATKSSYFITGGTYTNSGTKLIAFVEKINRSTLDTTKTAFFIDPGYNLAFTSIIKMNENKYFLFGNKGNSTISWPVMYQVDSNLNMINNITLVNPNPLNVTHANALYNPATNKILVQGLNLTGQYPLYFLDLDTLGSITNTYVSVSSRTTNVTQCYFSPSDSTYISVGNKKTGKYNQWDLVKLCITKYDINLKIVWQKMYGENNVLQGLYDAVVLADGSVVASGSYGRLSSQPLSNSDYAGVIIKVGKDGNFRWMREYSHYGPGMYREMFNGIDTTTEGGFVLCGNIMYQPKSKAWVIKTDAEGCVVSGCISSTLSVDSVLIKKDTVITTGILTNNNIYKCRVYPNPFSDRFMVEINEVPEAKRAYEIMLTDVAGRNIPISGEWLKSNVFECDAQRLFKGAYFLSIFHDKKLVSIEKIFRSKD